MKARRKVLEKSIVALVAITAFVMIFANVISAQSVSNAGTDALSVSNLVVSPQPVYPGQNVTISFQLYDSYPAQLLNVNLGLVGTYPFLNYSPSSTQLISSIGAGVYGGLGTYFTYTIHIPQYVQTGTYTIDVIATYETTVSGENIASESVMPISIYVNGKPSIAINANPSTAIVPGASTSVGLSGINIGTDLARNVSMTVLSNNNFTVVGNDQINLGQIDASSQASGTITLQANSTLGSGVHSIPVVLRYTSAYGAATSTVVQVPLSVVVNNPNIVVSVVGATPQFIYPGSNQTLTVSIQNIGTGTAKNLSIDFGSTGQISIGSSSSSLFIGSLAAGASSTSQLFITANKNDNGTIYSVPAMITYKNANYQQSYESTQNIGITLQKAAVFTVANVTSSLYPGATFVPVTFEVKNSGSEEADDVSLSLQTAYPVNPINVNGYIAKLAPGQSAQVTFYVSVDSQGSAGTYPVILFEQWSQQNGATSQQYVSSQNYYAQVNSGASNNAAISSTYIYLIIAVIVIAVGAWYVRSGRMKAKKQEAKSEGKSEGKGKK